MSDDSAIEDFLAAEDANWFESVVSRFKAHKHRKSQARTLRHAVRKEQIDRNERFVPHADRVGAVRVGTLKVDQLRAQNLVDYAQKRPYLYLQFEDNRFQTKRRDAPDESLRYSWEDETFEFPVTDVAADLRVALYSSKPGSSLVARTDLCVGVVILPLSRMLRTLEHSPEFSCWLEVYPLPPDLVAFRPIVSGLPVTGLERPQGRLGYVHLRLRLELSHHVLWSYVISPPHRSYTLRIDKKIEPRHLRGGLLRIKRALNSPPYFLTILKNVLEYDNVQISLGLLLWWGHLTMFAPTHSIPIQIAGVIVLLGYLSKNKQDRSHHKLYKDETVYDKKQPDTIPKKLRLVFSILGDVQVVVNKLSSLFEKTGNALNWTDARVSFLVSCLVLMLGTALSLALHLSAAFFAHVVSPGRFLFAIGCLIMLPPRVFEGPLLRKFREWSEAKYVEDEALDDDENDEKNDTKKLILQKEKPLVARLLANLWSRVPDEMEAAHRTIARSQEITHTTGENDSSSS